VRPRGEFELIAAIARAAGRGGRDVSLGIGDDCAVLRGSGGDDLLLTTDLLVEGRHFVASARPEDVGWKTLAVSVSDVAAMAGRPRHALLALALRPEATGEWATRFARGFLRCAKAFGVTLVGGDTNATDGPLVACATLTGGVRRGRAVLRSGARRGDAICVTGALGGSLAGRHLHVRPRVAEAAALVRSGPVHAMIDLSDGLSSDLGHVLDASGVGAELWADAVPVHRDARRAARVDGRDALDHALHDGEDFELLFTVPEKRAQELVRRGLGGTPVSWIGRVTAEGYGLRDRRDGAERPMERRGHDHFRAP
jgi:thiamine-monophosphate kinase